MFPLFTDKQQQDLNHFYYTCLKRVLFCPIISAPSSLTKFLWKSDVVNIGTNTLSYFLSPLMASYSSNRPMLMSSKKPESIKITELQEFFVQKDLLGTAPYSREFCVGIQTFPPMNLSQITNLMKSRYYLTSLLLSALSSSLPLCGIIN